MATLTRHGDTLVDVICREAKTGKTNFTYRDIEKAGGPNPLIQGRLKQSCLLGLRRDADRYGFDLTAISNGWNIKPKGEL